MADDHKNFAYSTIVTAPSPAASGTSLTVVMEQARLFPDVPFNATVWPTGVQPISTNAEIIRVTDRTDNVFTIERAQEGSSARTILVGDQIAATITSKSLSDAQASMVTYAPYILQSGAASVLQTLASASGQSATASMYVFPITIPERLQFNQLFIGNSLTIVTSANTASNSYYSLFGLYSMNANTLSLISSNSFSIGETLRSASATWNYPTTTETAGYGYGNFPAGNLTATAQRASYVTGTRLVGLQFGANMTLTGGVYWLGMLSLRSTGSNSQHGISHAGIIGHAIQPPNLVGSVSGLNPIGVAASNWTASASNVTGWWGRHIVGFVTATSITNQLGTALPSAVTLSALQAVAANSTATVLPAVTFVST
jgi:hypothetical protein